MVWREGPAQRSPVCPWEQDCSFREGLSWWEHRHVRNFYEVHISFEIVCRKLGKENPTFFNLHMFCFEGSLSTKYYWNSRWQNANFMKGKAALSGRLLVCMEELCKGRREGEWETEREESEVKMHISSWTTWLENDDHVYKCNLWCAGMEICKSCELVWKLKYLEGLISPYGDPSYLNGCKG